MFTSMEEAEINAYLRSYSIGYNQALKDLLLLEKIDKKLYDKLKKEQK